MADYSSVTRTGAGGLTWLEGLGPAWLAIAGITVGIAGLLAILVRGMVAYLGMAISFGRR